jgi:3-hydroxyacyl-CoA dehydrogenase/enoyl-CoA hydratase/3-hydroxybutyryl-CoA epimerase
MHLDKGRDGIATISLSEPGVKVYTLTLARLEALGKLLTQVKNSDARALAINIENLAGADLREILQGLDDPVLLRKIVETGHRVFSQLENLPLPTFAFIDKACLGGASELVLACKYRVVTDDPKTFLGFPEVKIGLFPCWGGTQRAPRLVGGPQAINLILNGEFVSVQQAREMRLVDAIFPRVMLKKQGKEFIDHCLTAKGEKQVIEDRKNLLAPTWPGYAKKEYMIPGQAALKLIYATTELSLEAGLKAEREVFLGMHIRARESAREQISAFLNKKAPSNARE